MCSSYLLAIGKPAFLRPARGFPALHGWGVTPTDYYERSVTWSALQALRP